MHKILILDQISERLGRQNLAYILILSAAILFPFGLIYTNQNKFNPFETLLSRGLVMIAVNYMIARHFKFQIYFSESTNFRILFVRNVIMTIHGLVFIWVQFYLTQPIIYTLACSGTLFVFCFDYLINGITITKKQFYGVVIGVVGVIFTVNGQFIMKFFYPNYSTTTQFKNYATNNPVQKIIAAFIFLLAQLAWAYAVIITKNLREVNSIQINYHMGLVISFIVAILFPTQVIQPVNIHAFLKSILYSSLVIVISQICFAGALTLTKNTGILNMLSFVSVIFGYLISVIRYKQQINPFCTAGTILILFGLAKIFLKSNQKKPLASQEILNN